MGPRGHVARRLRCQRPPAPARPGAASRAGAGFPGPAPSAPRAVWGARGAESAGPRRAHGFRPALGAAGGGCRALPARPLPPHPPAGSSQSPLLKLDPQPSLQRAWASPPAPSSSQASRRTTTDFPQKKALEPAKASRDELIRRWIGGGRDEAGQGWSVRCWDQLRVFWVRLLGYNQGVLCLSWKSIRCHLVPCWDLVVQSSGVGTLSGCSPLDVGTFTEFLDGVVGIHSGKVCNGSWSRGTWSRCGDCFSGFRVWVWCSSPGQAVGAFPGVSWKPI